MIASEETRDIVKEMAEGIPDEVSKLIVFLASDDSSYCTESEFGIDGDVTASN